MGSDGIVWKLCAAVPLFLTLGLVLASSAWAQPVVGPGQPGSSPSLVEIPVRLPLDRLFEMAEAQMPRQAGNWRRWQENYGVETKYRAWRGPLSLRAKGELLLVQAHVRYWIKGRKKVLGALELESSCGVDEPPRQAVIGVMIRLAWSPDWTLRPQFRVMPTRFLDRCEVTVADIDITPLVGKEFQNQLEDKMRAALKTLRPQLSALRHQAERSWYWLQQPVEVGADHWLVLNPVAIALSPLVGQGDRVDAHLAVVMEPRVINGSAPVVHSRPLPPLMRFYPRWAGLNLQLAVELNYADLSRMINERLTGQTIGIGGHQAGIEVLGLGGKGREIRMQGRLTGEAAGDVSITANLVFAEEEQAFQLQDLAYRYTPDDPWLEPEARLLYGMIRKSLEAAANQQLQQRMADWKERLVSVFDQVVPDEVTLELASLQLRQGQVEVEEGGIRLRGLATGHVQVEFR